MTLNERKKMNRKLATGESLTTAEAMSAFFLPEDADAVAQGFGWSDMRQMSYYEDMAAKEEAQLPPPPTVIHVDASQTGFIDSLRRCEVHELAKVDSREVYSDDDQCPPDDLRDWQDLAGVY